MENYTINDLINDLSNLKPELKKLPVCIITENGSKFKPKAKVLLAKYQTVLDEPKQMVITYE